MEAGDLSRTERIVLAEHLSEQGRRVVPVADLIVAIDEIATRAGSPDIERDVGELEAIASAIDAFDPVPRPDISARLREVAARIRDYQ